MLKSFESRIKPQSIPEAGARVGEIYRAVLGREVDAGTGRVGELQNASAFWASLDGSG